MGHRYGYREILLTLRKRAGGKRLADTFTKLNQVVKGWINYFKIGSMKGRMKEFGEWLRHKVRVIILKQWKKPKTIIRNLGILSGWSLIHFCETYLA